MTMGVAWSRVPRPRRAATSLWRNPTGKVRGPYAMEIIPIPIVICIVVHVFGHVVLDVDERGGLIGRIRLGRRDVQVLVHGVGVCLLHLLVLIIRHVLVINAADGLANPIII